MAQNSGGGAKTAPNRAPAAKVIAGALANNRVAQSLIGALGAFNIAALIVATAASQTTDFGALAVGDKVLHLSAAAPATAQGVYTVTIAGTLPVLGIIGDIYLVLRPQNLDANNPLGGNHTGDGGTDF